MPWTYTEEYYREYTRTTWNESAVAYARFARCLEPFGRELLDSARPRPGERVLDLATGPGEPALTIAKQVAPSGSVVGVDLAEEMIALARRAVADQRIDNARFEAMDCCALRLPDATFDLVTSRFGFQIFTDPGTAAKESLRVLRLGGRIALSVWGRGANVPFLDVFIAPMLEHAEPDEHGYIPTPYEMGGPGEMVEFLSAAGFETAVERSVHHSVRFASADEYLETILRSTPLGHSLGEETPEVQAEVLQKTRVNLERWRDADGILLPAECVIATALRPL